MLGVYQRGPAFWAHPNSTLFWILMLISGEARPSSEGSVLRRVLRGNRSLSSRLGLESAWFGFSFEFVAVGFVVWVVCQASDSN